MESEENNHKATCLANIRETSSCSRCEQIQRLTARQYAETEWSQDTHP